MSTSDVSRIVAIMSKEKKLQGVHIYDMDVSGKRYRVFGDVHFQESSVLVEAMPRDRHKKQKSQNKTGPRKGE